MILTNEYKPVLSVLPWKLPHGDHLPLQILREDLAHPFGQGNKFWKLKNNLLRAREAGLDTLLTFGGAWSNHIHATAATGHLHGFKTIGVIRGEEPRQDSPTLQFARAQGMRLHFVSRAEYRLKNSPGFIYELKNHFGSFYLIPEGGANEAGFQGCMEWGKLLTGIADDYCLAAGTGSTAAGIASALQMLQPAARVYAISVLKDGAFLKENAAQIARRELPNLEIITGYHFGGYAKTTPVLLNFIREIETAHKIPLDPVYTAKALYGVIDRAHRGVWEKKRSVCFIHTGGLQRTN